LFIWCTFSLPSVYLTVKNFSPSIASTSRRQLNLALSSQTHPFHILDGSPYPLLTALFLFIMLVPLTFSLHDSSLFPISVTEGTLTGLTLFLVTIFA
jgi:hypothetical protein